MNKKLISFSLSIISTISLSACQNREIKIDNNAGKETVNTVLKSTNQKLNDYRNGEFVSVDLSSNIVGKANFLFSKQDVENYSREFNNDINASVKFQTNQNITSLKSEQPVIDDSELYLEYNVLYNTEFANQIIYQKGDSFISKTTDTAHPDGKLRIEKLNEEDIKSYADFVLNSFDSSNIYDLISDSISVNVDVESVEYLEDQLNKFRNKTITSKQFIDNINHYYFSDSLFLNAKEGTYETAIKLLDNYDSFSLSNYFDYSKITDAEKITTLNASFDAKAWLEGTNSALNKITTDLNNEGVSTEYFEEFKESFTKILPSELSSSFVIKFDSDNVINYFKFDIKTVGSFDYNLQKNNYSSNSISISYDIDLSFDLSLQIKNEAIITNKLDFTSK